jgi:regulatory protein
LESKGLTQNCIRIGLKEIEEEDYCQTLTVLLKSKIAELDESNVFVLRDKASKFAVRKGYEPDLVWKVLQELLRE